MIGDEPFPFRRIDERAVRGRLETRAVVGGKHHGVARVGLPRTGQRAGAERRDRARLVRQRAAVGEQQVIPAAVLENIRALEKFVAAPVHRWEVALEPKAVGRQLVDDRLVGEQIEPAVVIGEESGINAKDAEALHLIGAGRFVGIIDEELAVARRRVDQELFRVGVVAHLHAPDAEARVAGLELRVRRKGVADVFPVDEVAAVRDRDARLPAEARAACVIVVAHADHARIGPVAAHDGIGELARPRFREQHGRERGQHAAQLLRDEPAERQPARGVEVGGVGLAVRHRVECGRFGGADPLAIRHAQRVKVEQRHLFRGRDPLHRLDIGKQVGLEPVRVRRIEVAARKGGHEHRLAADGAHLVHIAGQVGGISGGRIGLAVGPLARLVVMAELDQVIIALERQRRRPVSLVAKALRTGARSGAVLADVAPSVTNRREAVTPSALVVDGGVAHHQHDVRPRGRIFRRRAEHRQQRQQQQARAGKFMGRAGSSRRRRRGLSPA